MKSMTETKILGMMTKRKAPGSRKLAGQIFAYVWKVYLVWRQYNPQRFSLPYLSDVFARKIQINQVCQERQLFEHMKRQIRLIEELFKWLWFEPSDISYKEKQKFALTNKI